MLKRARRRDALGHIGRHNRCKGHTGRERCGGCLGSADTLGMPDLAPFGGQPGAAPDTTGATWVPTLKRGRA